MPIQLTCTVAKASSSEVYAGLGWLQNLNTLTCSEVDNVPAVHLSLLMMLILKHALDSPSITKWATTNDDERNNVIPCDTWTH